MITIIDKFNRRAPLGPGMTRSGFAAFTLVEIMLSLTILGFVVGSIMATFLSFSKSVRSVGHYSEMNQDSRYALETFARDVRAAEDVTLASTNELNLVLPSTTPYDGRQIRYEFDPLMAVFSRVERDSGGNEIGSTILLDGVNEFALSYYDPLGAELALSTPSLLLSVKGVQLEAEMLREILTTEATDFVISARFMMRNRPVTE